MYKEMLFQISVFLFFFSTCLAGEQDVIDLTDDDFSSRLQEHDTVLVMFYAPWCGHCKRLKPEFAKAAEDLLRNDPPIALAKVDCTEGGKETCNKFGVSGYPTLKIFRNGDTDPQDYNGPREAAGIVKYMRAQVGPSSKELSSIADLEKFLKSDEVGIIGFFEKESDLKVSYMKLADKLREKMRFAHTSYKELLEKQDVTDGIVLFRPAHLKNKFEDDQVVFTGEPVTGDINDFITKNYHGLVGHRTTENRQDFDNPLLVAYFSVDYVKNPKGTNYWRNRILKVAKAYKGTLKFAISSKDDFQHELNEFGIDFVKGDKPLCFARNSKNQKFALKEEFSIEALEEFVQDLLADKLEPYLKSEAIPDSNDGAVTVAVAKNFEDVVTNNGKDTLIEFYAPWCGHCKKLTPIYDELGEKLMDEDVAIVKMDATANDVPLPYQVRGFPTLFWVPRDKKDSPVSYDGGRTLDDFLEYIAKHATVELKAYDRKGNPKKKSDEKTEL